ncbi:uncharacterized protein LOC144763238 isoform X2 [Lissotriton helveticus]
MLLSLESSSPLKRAASGLATSLLLCLSWPPLLFRGARRASQSLNFGESYARRQRDGTPEQRWCGVDPAKTRNSGNVICLISTRILEAKNCGELGLTQDFLDLNESRSQQTNVHLKQTATVEVKSVMARPVWSPKVGDLVREKIDDKKEFGPSYRKPVQVLAVEGTRTVLLPPLARKREKRFDSIDLIKPNYVADIE